MIKEEYKKNLETVAKLLAYVAFSDDASTPLEERGATHNDIKSFNVIFFFTQTLEEDNETPIVNLKVRFTVELTIEGDSSLTFMYDQDEYKTAIINNLYNSSFGSYQHFNFTFPQPSSIELFDAFRALDEILGLE